MRASSSDQKGADWFDTDQNGTDTIFPSATWPLQLQSMRIEARLV